MELIKQINEKIEELLRGRIPETVFISDDCDEYSRQLGESFNKLIYSISEIFNFVIPLSKGNLQDIYIDRWNALGSPFKELHSRLLNLTWQAKQIAGGDYSQRIDFMGDFSSSFNSMVIALDNKEKSLRSKIEELENKNRKIEFELNIARTVQSALIPTKMPPFEGAVFYSVYKPVAQVGGDLFDFIPCGSGNKMGVFISDVSGHGVPAALITSMVKTLLTTAGDNKESPSEMLKFLNRGLVDLTGENFLTAFYGIFDPLTGEFKYSRCGHGYPLLLRNSSIVEIKSSGTIIGIMNDIKVEEKVIDLVKGDKLIFFTDGLTESVNSDGECFEVRMIDQVLPEINGLEINKLLDELYRRLLEFAGSREADDDICIVGMEVV